MAHTRARGRPRSRPTRHPHHDGWLIFTRPEQHWFFRLLGMIIRFRAELTLITLTVIGYRHLQAHWGLVTVSVTGIPPVTVDFSDPTVITTVLGATLLVLAAIPATRQYLYRRVWCVITRHRVRSCLVQTHTMARQNGRLPFLIWARPSPVGEHLTVWLPAGLAVNDLDRVAPQLAAACCAKECRVTAFGWKVMLVDVHIVRRDPLGTRTVHTDIPTDGGTDVDRDIDRDTDSQDSADTADAVDGPTRDRQTAAVVSLTPALRRASANPATGNASPEPGNTPPTLRKVPAPRKPSDPTTTSTTTPTGTSSPGTDPGVTGYGGVDVSDYV